MSCADLQADLLGGGQVLIGASAAFAVVRTARLGAVRTGFEHFRDGPAREPAMPRRQPHEQPVADRGEGHEDRPPVGQPADSVAAVRHVMNLDFNRMIHAAILSRAPGAVTRAPDIFTRKMIDFRAEHDTLKRGNRRAARARRKKETCRVPHSLPRGSFHPTMARWEPVRPLAAARLLPARTRPASGPYREHRAVRADPKYAPRPDRLHLYPPRHRAPGREHVLPVGIRQRGLRARGEPGILSHLSRARRCGGAGASVHERCAGRRRKRRDQRHRGHVPGVVPDELPESLLPVALRNRRLPGAKLLDDSVLAGLRQSRRGPWLGRRGVLGAPERIRGRVRAGGFPSQARSGPDGAA